MKTSCRLDRLEKFLEKVKPAEPLPVANRQTGQFTPLLGEQGKADQPDAYHPPQLAIPRIPQQF